MPAIYAHLRLGEEVREELDGEEKQAVEAYPELFRTGTHGPDILFYYRPLSHNAVSGLGHRMHAETGGVFFERAAEILNGGQEICDPASLAYVYGFLCHFALDVCCHGYISEYIAAHGVSHAKIESELDRELMVRDGYDPVSHSIVGHLVPSDENARVIARFYGRNAESKEKNFSKDDLSGKTDPASQINSEPIPEITEKEIKKALRSMIFYSGVLLAPSRPKRACLNFGMNIIGATGFQDMMIGLTKDPRCGESTEELIGRYEEAKQLALRLIKTYRRQFLTKEEAPDEIYRYNFESVK